MMRRLRWFLLIAAAGCYFETPTHPALDGAMEPVDIPEGGSGSGEDGGGPGPDENEGGTEAGVIEPGEGGSPGMDGGHDGSSPGSEAGPGPGMDGAIAIDGGPGCACDAGRPICLTPGTCVQCTADMKTACTGDKPVCDVSSGSCVACNVDADCPSALRAKCDVASHSCVPCDAKAQCAHIAGLNVCAGGGCVQCSASDATACTGTTKPFCQTGGSACVACNTNQDCSTDPTKPTCDANVCRACRNETDCSGKTSGATTLDACYMGQCVDCRITSTTDTKMDVGCTGNIACNPATRTCSGKTKNSVGICQTCVADAECQTNHRCVPMMYGNTPVGSYCMKLAMSCPDGYTAPALRKTSLSGAAAADYCGIVEARTSCEAVRNLVELGTTCPTGAAAACNARGALCQSVNAGATLRCTYPCVQPVECPSLTACGGPDGAKYCGGSP